MPKSPTARTLFIERMKRDGGTPTPPPGRRARKMGGVLKETGSVTPVINISPQLVRVLHNMSVKPLDLQDDSESDSEQTINNE